MFTFQQNYTRRKLQKSVTVTATRLTPTTQSAYRPRGSDSLVVTRQANVWRWQQQILILTTCPSSSTQNTFRGRCRQAHHFQGNSFYVFHTTGSQTVLYTTSVNSILNQPKKNRTFPIKTFLCIIIIMQVCYLISLAIVSLFDNYFLFIMNE